MGDLISGNAVIAIIKNKRLLLGKRDLSVEYKIAGAQEEIENLPVCDIDKNLDKLKDCLFEKYCVEGNSKINEIIKEKRRNNRRKIYNRTSFRCYYTRG